MATPKRSANPIPKVESSQPITLPEYIIHKTYASMRLLRTDAGPNTTVYASGLSAQGSSGYQSLRGSHGIFDGALYFEVFWHPQTHLPDLPLPLSEQPQFASTPPTSLNTMHIIPSLDSLGYPNHSRMVPTETMVRPDFALASARLSQSPNTLSGQDTNLRIGFSTLSMDLQTPVGYADCTFGYRSSNGAKVANSIVETYGDSFKPGDIIGCFLYFPPYSNTIDSSSLVHQVSRKLGPGDSLTDREEFQKELYEFQYSFAHVGPRPGSFIEYFKNGVSQGVAFTGLPVETFYPTISLFNHAAVTVNFGPDFAYPPLPYASTRSVPAPLNQPITLTAAAIYKSILAIDANYRVLYTPFAMSVQEIYEAKLKEATNPGKTSIKALVPIFSTQPSKPKLMPKLTKAAIAAAANSPKQPHGNTGRGRAPKGQIRLPVTPIIVNYRLLLGPLLQIPFWFRDGAINPQLRGLYRQAWADSRLTILQPRHSARPPGYSLTYQFPSFTTTSFMYRYKDYFEWEMEAIFVMIFQRLDLLIKSKVAATINLPADLINATFPQPRLHYVTRTRLNFVPHLVPNVRSHEVYDDLIMPVPNNSPFLKHLVEVLHDPNVVFHLTKRFFNVPKIVAQYKLYQEHLGLTQTPKSDDMGPILTPLATAVSTSSPTSSTTTTTTSTTTTQKFPSMKQHALLAAEQNNITMGLTPTITPTVTPTATTTTTTKPKGKLSSTRSRTAMNDDDYNDDNLEYISTSTTTTKKNPPKKKTTATTTASIPKPTRGTKSNNDNSRVKLITPEDQALLDTLLAAQTPPPNGVFDTALVPVMESIDRDFVRLSQHFNRQFTQVVSTQQSRRVAKFLTARSTFIMSTNIEEIVAAEKRAALVAVKEWLLFQYQHHARTTTNPSHSPAHSTRLHPNQAMRRRPIQLSEQPLDQFSVRRAIMERNVSWRTHLKTLTTEFRRASIEYARTLPTKPKTPRAPKPSVPTAGKRGPKPKATKGKK